MDHDDTEITVAFITKDGRTVQIRIDEDGTEIKIQDCGGVAIGRIELEEIEEADESTIYRICWMYMDLGDPSYVRQGIGRAALKFHQEVFNTPIVARTDDRLTKVDGSHLTGDAPAFVAALIQEGVLCKDHVDYDMDHDDISL